MCTCCLLNNSFLVHGKELIVLFAEKMEHGWPGYGSIRTACLTAVSLIDTLSLMNMHDINQNAPWQKLPGMNGRFAQLLHHADLTSCNCYVLRFQECFVIIDPGGKRERLNVLRELCEKDDPSRFVWVLLTHCHCDHSRTLQWIRAPELFPACVTCCHVTGAEALLRGDEQLTSAFLYPDSLKAVQIDRPLFADDAAGSVQHLRFPLPGENYLILHHTPGHSRDSMCIQVGSILFTGDLLFAHQPVVAGMPGWSAADQDASLRYVLKLLDEQSVTILYGGHGRPLDAHAARRIIHAALDSVKQLDAVQSIDVNRVQFLKDCSAVFMREVDVQMAAQGGRLQRLAYGLAELEESEFAEQILKQLDLDAFELFLSDFHEFSASPDKHALLTAVPLRGVAMIRNIRKTLRSLELPGKLIEAFLFRMEVLLQAYLSIMRGIDARCFAEPVDVFALLRQYALLLSPPQPDLNELHQLAEDETAFAVYLALRIDQHARSSTLSIPNEIEPRVMWHVNRDHLSVLLGDVLELAMSGTARTISITPWISDRASGFRLHAQPSFALSTQKQQFYDLFIRHLGGTLLLEPSGLSMGFPQQ